jgi:hypothetical protein
MYPETQVGKWYLQIFRQPDAVIVTLTQSGRGLQKKAFSQEVRLPRPSKLPTLPTLPTSPTEVRGEVATGNSQFPN